MEDFLFFSPNFFSCKVKQVVTLKLLQLLSYFDFSKRTTSTFVLITILEFLLPISPICHLASYNIPLMRRFHLMCPEKWTSTIVISASKMTIPAKPWLWTTNNAYYHYQAQIVSQEATSGLLHRLKSSCQRCMLQHPSPAIIPPIWRRWTANNDTTGHDQWNRTAHWSGPIIHSQWSTPRTQGNWEQSQSASNGSGRQNTILMAPYNANHAY